MKVIGAGFGRTGTASMKEALELLGFGPCYHMVEVMKHPNHIPFWHTAAFGGGVEWDDIFSGFDSAVDWPASHFWETLAARYPKARILLTVRPADEWYTSVTNTIFRHLDGMEPKDDTRLWKEMVDKIIRKETFNDKTDDRAHCEAVFDRHVEYVKATAHGDRLIVYELGSGWAPLCKGLNVPIPDDPFPLKNTTKEFQDRV